MDGFTDKIFLQLYISIKLIKKRKHFASLSLKFYRD